MLSQNDHFLTSITNTMSSDTTNPPNFDDDWNQTITDLESTDLPEQENTKSTEAVKKFEQMDLKEHILRAIFFAGYETPSVCQRTAIPIALKNLRSHMTVQAATGSGKTLCFIIAAANSIEPNVKQTQVIILVPTRELAFQTYNKFAIALFGTTHADDPVISVALHRGTTPGGKTGIKSCGQKYFTSHKAHSGTEHIVISTPKRLLALLTESTWVGPSHFMQIKTDYIQQIVIDECDIMLSTAETVRDEGMTTAECVKEIMNITPKFARKSLYSATMSENVKLITKELGASFLEFVPTKKIGDTVKNYYVILPNEVDKIDCLINIMAEMETHGSIFIFVASIDKAKVIVNILSDNTFPVGIIHGKMTQPERDKAIQDLNDTKIRILVATDIAARGLDIPSVDLVFQYDLPDETETFMHRSGRAGRFGKIGICISFVLQSGHTKPAEIIRIEKERLITIPHLPKLDTLTY
jgi:superfamily II DNA/RNA helicase